MRKTASREGLRNLIRWEILLLTIVFTTVSCLSNNNNNNNVPNLGKNFDRAKNNFELPPTSLPLDNNNNDDDDDDDCQQYSLNQHISFNPEDDKLSVSAETETVTFFGDNRRHNNPLFCNGGGGERDDTPLGDNASLFVTVAECRCEGDASAASTVFFDSDDEEESDDDDDDDDGHGMMLSTASFRRSLVAAHGGPGQRNDRGQPLPSSPPAKPTRHDAPFHSSDGSSTAVTSLSRHRTPLLLSVRGGATPSSTTSASTLVHKLLVAAIVTLVYEGLIGHLLEFVKIVMQTSPAGTSYGDVLRLITAEKGFAGIWDGFIPWGMVQAVAKGGVFGVARAAVWGYLSPIVERGGLSTRTAATVAGGIAGGFQGYVLSPTLLLKTRVMTNPVFRESMSLWKTTFLSLTIGFDVVLNEGLPALMKGANVFALKRVFDWATRFYFSDVFERVLKVVLGKSELTPMQKVYADLLGGTASTLSTLPLDVLVAKTQDAKKAGVKVSVVTMFMDELREKGLKGLSDSYMRGFEARLAHVCFTTVAMKTGTAIVYDALFKDK